MDIVNQPKKNGGGAPPFHKIDPMHMYESFNYCPSKSVGSFVSRVTKIVHQPFLDGNFLLPFLVF
jgi:hypothetical protein